MAYALYGDGVKLAIDCARLAAWVSLTVLFGVLSWVSFEMRAVPAHLNGVLLRAEGVESKINASAVNLDNATGAWAKSAERQAASVDAVIQAVGGTLAQANATVSDLRGSVAVANEQMAHVGPVLDAARQTVAGIGEQAQQLTDAAKPVLAGAAKTEMDVDALVTAPELKAMLADGREALGSVRETSANVAAGSAEATVIVHDVRKTADAVAAKPPWYMRLLGVR